MNTTILHFHQQQEQLVDDVCETLSARINPTFIYANLSAIRRTIEIALSVCDRFGERDPDVVFADICAFTRIQLRRIQIDMHVPGILYETNMLGTRSGHRKPKNTSPFDRDEHNPSNDRNRYIHDHLESIC